MPVTPRPRKEPDADVLERLRRAGHRRVKAEAEIRAAVEVDSEVPRGALAAVAEILSYVYRARGLAPPPKEADA